MQNKYKITALARAISLIAFSSISSFAFALEALDDQSLKDVTGEGIAFTLNDFSMQFNGANDSAGTGYTRFIPVGPLSSTINAYNTANPNTKIGKGDVWLYGLSISGNDGNVNTQFSGNTVNIGTADNPWLISVNTVTTPNFAVDDKPLSILTVEAPLQTNLVNASGALLPTDPNSYDLKLGTWADAFVRDPSKVENLTATDDQFDLNGAGRANRLRLQTIINGVSLNGTNLKLFQTLDGANTASGLGSSYSGYNNTLGLAATVRINSGASDTAASRATTTGSGTSTTSTSRFTDNAINLYSTTNIDRPGASNNNANSYQLRLVPVTYTTTTTAGGYDLPSDYENHIMRLSTQECGTGSKSGCTGTPQGLLDTPALNSALTMPTFDSKEGLFLYKPNINLVLGSQWQPVILGVAPDGKNLVFEVTRIPNVANVYKQIYTDYTGADATYKGGTCSVYWCGGDGNGISKNATHSSITIGSTVYKPPVNNPTLPTDPKTPLSITAYSGSGALGVSFGKLEGGSIAGSTSTSKYYQLQARMRWGQSSTQWRYAAGETISTNPNITASSLPSAFNTLPSFVSATGYNTGTNNCSNSATNINTCFQWDARSINSPNGVAWFDINSIDLGTTIASGEAGYDPNVSHAYVVHNNFCPLVGGSGSPCSSTTNTNARQFTVPTWGGAAWWTSQGFTGGADYVGTKFSSTDPYRNGAGMPATTTTSLSPLNNLGSAVIDGMLIQHMKITTKGL